MNRDWITNHRYTDKNEVVVLKLISKHKSGWNWLRLHYPTYERFQTYEVFNLWANQTYELIKLLKGWKMEKDNIFVTLNLKTTMIINMNQLNFWSLHWPFKITRFDNIEEKFSKASQSSWEVRQNQKDKCQQKWFLEVGAPIFPSSKSNIAMSNF